VPPTDSPLPFGARRPCIATCRRAPIVSLTPSAPVYGGTNKCLRSCGRRPLARALPGPHPVRSRGLRVSLHVRSARLHDLSRLGSISLVAFCLADRFSLNMEVLNGYTRGWGPPRVVSYVSRTRSSATWWFVSFADVVGILPAWRTWLLVRNEGQQDLTYYQELSFRGRWNNCAKSAE